MDPRIALLMILLAGCAASGEKLFRECLLLDRDAVYTQSRDLQKIECRR